MAVQSVFVCFLAVVAAASATGRFRSKQPIITAQKAAQTSVPVQDLMVDSYVTGASPPQAQEPATPQPAVLVDSYVAGVSPPQAQVPATPQAALPVDPVSIAQAAVPVDPVSIAQAAATQSANPPFAIPQALPATPSKVVTLQSHSPKEVVKMAFGQITDLGSEFHQLREDDLAHTKQLGVDVHLRQKLEEELRQAEQKLGQDNTEVARETLDIAGPPAAEGQAADTQNSSIAVNAGASLVQATVLSGTSDPIAANVTKDVTAINGDISALHTRDMKEMQALKGNADTRKSLSDQIAEERKELDNDAGGLAANLGKIGSLVGYPSTDVSAQTETPSPAPVTA